MQPKTIRLLEKCIYTAILLAALWLTSRYLLKWIAPFIPAFILAAIIESPVKKLCNGGWKRSWASAVMTFLVLSLIAGACVSAASASLSRLSILIGELPELAAKADTLVMRIKGLLSRFSSSSGGIIGNYISGAIEASVNDIATVPELILSKALAAAASVAQVGPDVLLFVATAGIGTYFLSASYEKTIAFLSCQLPKSALERISEILRHLRDSFGGWLRAQLILMLITFFELLTVFMLLRVKGAGLLAVVTAIIDALPVFGTGIVLLPWAVYSMLAGDTVRAIWLAVSWGIISIVRSCIQAKLLGDQIGLNPLASLFSIYVGWRVWGVLGMITFPLLLVLLQKLNDSGVITLWKRA